MRDSSGLIGRSGTAINGVSDAYKALGGSASESAREMFRANQAIGDSAEEAAARVSEAAAVQARAYARQTEAARAASRTSRSSGGSGLLGGAATGAVGSRAAGIVGGVGLASAVILGGGVKIATDQQTRVQRIATMTGRSPSDVSKDFMPMARDFSHRTGGSVNDALDMVAVAAGIFKNPVELKRVLTGTGREGGLLDYAQVLKNSGHGDNAAETARTLVFADHILNAYNQRDSAMVNRTIFSAAISDHLELKKFVTGLSYFAEQAKLSMGNRVGSTSDILGMAEAAYFSSGNGQKWGAGLNQVENAILKPTKAQIPALVRLGLLNRNGSPSSAAMNARGELTPVATIAAIRKNLDGLTPVAGQQLLRQGFSVNGARQVAAITSQKSIAFVRRLVAAQANVAPVRSIEAAQIDNLGGATKQLTEDFKNLAGILSGPLIEPLTRLVRAVDAGVFNAGRYLSGHPTANAAASGALAITAGFGIARAARHFFGGHARHGVEAAESVAKSGFRGGKIAEAAFDLLSFAPMGRFLRGGIDAARGIGGFVGGIGGARGIGALASGAMQAMPWIGRMAGAFGKLGGVAKLAGAIVGAVARVGLPMLVEGIAKFGLRAIPVVGNILMIVDALKFFSAHAFDVGHALGVAVKWIRTEGWTMFKNAIVGMITFAFNGLKDTIAALVTGGNGGLVGAFKSAIAGFNAANADTPSRPSVAAGSTNHGVVVQGDVHLHGVSRSSEIHGALTGQAKAQHTARTTGGNTLFPAWAMSGTGGGTR